MHGITETLLETLATHWLSIGASLIVAWLVKNHYNNGLNKYPGPFLASLTDWWRFFDVKGQRPEVTHQKLHEKYGDVVRLGPNTLSFADPAALKTIYGLNKGFVKSDFYIVQQSVVKGHSLQSLFSTTDNSFHSQFRRCVNSAFSMSALVQYEPFVDNTTKLFLSQTEKLFAGNPEGCDFTTWLQFYAFDVIGEITYSKRHGFIEKNEDIDGIVAYLSKLFLYVAPIGQIPLLDRLFLKNPIYLKLSQWGFIDSTFPVARFARARMAERLPELNGKEPLLPVTNGKKLAEQPDLLSKFLAAREARPDFMSDVLVQTMAVSMAFAGSETTAISLAAVFYYLLRTPTALARLKEELDQFGREGGFSDTETGLVTWTESQKLVYLDACIKEAFRMHPAAGLPLERIVPEQGAEIAGTFVKGGTIVGCSAWIIHRRPEIWGADVDTYRPERWLVDETKDREAEEQRIKEMNGHMFQFGMGSRTCIGKNISLLEIYKVVPSLLRRFDIKFKDPNQEWQLINAWFVKQVNFYTMFAPRDIVKPEVNEKSS
ncbi:Cytochrome P450 monooxygenase andK [Colletotrichum gloeosporioides]|uniref:Cytochrome P450 monooxygenase andK n=1 Tax=Colletotrichum gloeosporioides TaxID=474922 RepID=A0A8H4FPY8_COLGL|nr:Cytochrome P450 monooxygenase andK [Colletotrichum gloeosporioides]KAF3810152.1 Cytochrome P450 monooxygenase andK [Colletotrichum gloeosporioides]